MVDRREEDYFKSQVDFAAVTKVCGLSSIFELKFHY